MELQRLVRRAQQSSISSALRLATGAGEDWKTVNPRHIFRALLRQSTYLPDSAARSYFREYIIMRFRSYNPRPPVPYSITSRLQEPSVKKNLLKQARSGLAFLQRANDGHPSQLEKALAMTYGRQGRRRRELLQEFIQEPSPGHNNLAHLVTSASSKDSSPSLHERMRALFKSQRVQRSQKLSIPREIGIEPVIPKTNSWGRPMPIRRARNIRKRWYAAVLQRMMPPLPEKEWVRLRDLSSGQLQWERPIPRRKKGTSNEDKNINYSRSMASKLETLQSSKMRNWELKTNPHQLRPRFMRRVWAKIFELSPLMTWDEIQGRWVVQWGKLHVNQKSTVVLEEVVNTSLFDGVNEKGLRVEINQVSSRQFQAPYRRKYQRLTHEVGIHKGPYQPLFCLGVFYPGKIQIHDLQYRHFYGS